MELNLNFEVSGQQIPGLRDIETNLKKGNWRRKRVDAKRIFKKIKFNSNAQLSTKNAGDLYSSKLDSGIASNIISNTMPATEINSSLVPTPLNPSKSQTPNQNSNPNAKKLGFSSSLFTSNPTPNSQITEKKVPSKKYVEPLQEIIENLDTINEKSQIESHDKNSFDGLVDQVLVQHLSKLKIKNPTEIQSKIKSFGSHDVIIKAQTGSGKTLAFLLPILDALIKCSRGKNDFDRSSGCFAIILVPTRELVQQITQVLDSLLKYTSDHVNKHWIVNGFISGGESKKSEKSRLRKGVSILVCTPGRLLDHLKTTSSFKLQLRWLVLDEADELLQLGFEESLREILLLLSDTVLIPIEGLSNKRQTILCSATIQGNVERLAQEMLANPTFINCDVEVNLLDGKQDNQAMPSLLEQYYILSPAKLRLVNLIGLIRKISSGSSKIIVFLATGDSVDWHFHLLNNAMQEDKVSSEVVLPTYTDLPQLRLGYTSKLFSESKLFKLHGSMMQSERNAVFTGYQSTPNSILFCTDVAARGIDVPDITDVIQYDPPSDVRDYIHRVGRTARVGRKGSAYCFLLPSEVDYLDLLHDHNCYPKEQQTKALLQTLTELQDRKSKHAGHEVAATDLHMSLERYTSAPLVLPLAIKGYSSHIRAYTTHSSTEKHIFHVKKLHLGHVAKSFCLRDTPVVIRGLGKEKEASVGGGVTALTMKRKAIVMARDMLTSEFADGGVSKRINI